MFGLEKVADGFDHMHEEVQRDFENKVLRDWGRDAGEAWGDDSWKTYGTAIGAGLIYSLGTFIMASGKSLVDTLRLGEGVKSGTVSGIGQDALRVLNLLPAVGAVAKGLGVGGRLAMAAKVGAVVGQEGAMSCGPTAIAAAGRVSGQNVALTLDEVGQALGKGVHPNAPNFPGMYMNEVKAVVKSVSLTNQELNLEGAGVEAVEGAVKSGKGPVIFGIHYWETTAQGITQPATQMIRDANGVPKIDLRTWELMRDYSNLGKGYQAAPQHYLVAFQRFGKVMVADQYGIRPIAKLGEGVGAANHFTLATEAIQVTDGALLGSTPALRALATVERVGSATGPLRGTAARSVIGTSFGLNMVVVNAPKTWQLDTAIRAIQGRPPREWPGMPPGTIPAGSTSGKPGSGTADPAQPNGAGPGGGGGVIPAPNAIPLPNILSQTLEKDSALVLSKLPANGDSREFAQIKVETGLSDTRVRDALLQLTRGGLATARSWFLMQGLATPAAVARSMRR